MRNFNSPNHGSNIQHLKHEAKTNLIKSVVTGEPTKLLRRPSNWHSAIRSQNVRDVYSPPFLLKICCCTTLQKLHVHWSITFMLSIQYTYYDISITLDFLLTSQNLALQKISPRHHILCNVFKRQELCHKSEVNVG